MDILGIETSCDETAAAVVRNGREVLSNVVYTQIPLHQPYGGVVPEIASRAHVEKISQVVGDALNGQHVDAVAVTYGPGLSPALIVGLNAAKGLAKSLNVPLLAINHIEAHLHTPFLFDSGETPAPFAPEECCPALGLAVSGGNTVWIDMPEYGKYEVIGETLDDAAGEAFDKAAKILDLGYPGGPVIERLAKQGDPHAVNFPRSLTPSSGKPVAPENRFHFSFSGVKTALLYHVKNLGGVENIRDQVLFDILASYQEAIVDVLCRKAFDAAQQFNVRSIVLAGGVACNGALRERFQATVPKRYRAVLPLKKYCTDNAAMVGGLGWHYWKRGVTAEPGLDAQARLPLNQTIPIWFDKVQP